jgi:histidine phosphotransferase ChpT
VIDGDDSARADGDERPAQGDPSAGGDGSVPTREGPDLVALLGSRLCHDLVSPLGAIGNGLELLEMSGAVGAGEEMALIRGALDAALARIAFFRICFGAASGDAVLTAREMREVLDRMYADTRVAVAWRDDADRPRAEMRLACLALNCIETATPFGARIEVTRSPAAWVMHVDADRLRLDEGRWRALGAGRVPDDLAGSEVQFGILADACRRMRRPISVSGDATHLSLIV